MVKNLFFRYGALVDSLLKQPNEQGYTLGSEADIFERMEYGLVLNYIQGTLTVRQYHRALDKLNKRVIKAIAPIDKEL